MSTADTSMVASAAVTPWRRRDAKQDDLPMSKHAGPSRSARVQLTLGVIAMITAVLLVVVSSLNRSLQADVAAGQARIANAQTAANVNNTLIRLLAKAAAENNDDKIRALLAQNGISFRQNAPAAK